MDSKSEKFKIASSATIIALLVNEILNFIKLEGLNNPLALSLFKILLYLFLLGIMYSSNTNKYFGIVLTKIEDLLTEIRNLEKNGIVARDEN